MIKLTYQNYGTSILIFIQGETNQAAYGKWLSLANWGATSLLNGEEPQFVANGIISCWSTIDKLKKYLFDRAIMGLWEAQGEQAKGKRDGFKAEALAQAEKEFAAIETESFRSVNSNFEIYEMGTISAEKPDDDFKDLATKFAFRA